MDDIPFELGRRSRANGQPRVSPYISLDYQRRWFAGWDQEHSAQKPKYAGTLSDGLTNVGYCPGDNAVREVQNAMANPTVYDVYTDQRRPAIQGDIDGLYAQIRTLRKVVSGRDTEAVELRRLLEVQNQWVMELIAKNADLERRLAVPTETGHDYIGPTKKDPDTGKNVPIPDPVHERFHGAVGDVMAGKVLPEARRQMQEALKNAPKEKPQFPVGGSKDDPRRIGWRV